MRCLLKPLGLAAALLLSAVPALAEEPLLLVGVGAGAERSPYRGVDPRGSLLPLVIYENDWLSVAGPGLDVKLPALGPLQLRLRARYAFDGYKAKDAPALAGMARRKASPWVGAAAIWETGLGEFSLELLGDAASNSKGRQWQLAWERRFQLSEQLDLTPRLGLRGLDQRYVDYYYGVRAAEARTGRAEYRGKASGEAELGLRLGYVLDAEQMLFADLSARRLGRAISDSPLLAQRYEAGLFAGWMHRF